MAKVSIDSLSLAEMKALMAELPRAIASKESEERSQFIREMEKEAAQRGIDLGSIIPTKSGAYRQSKPVAPKYRNPENPSETWSGRGRTPRWLAALEAKGKKRAAFAIK